MSASLASVINSLVIGQQAVGQFGDIRHKPGALTLTEMHKCTVSQRRNPLIADLFRRIGPDEGGRWEVLNLPKTDGTTP